MSGSSVGISIGNSLQFFGGNFVGWKANGKYGISGLPPVVIPAYFTVTFETAPTGDLLTWLQANATKQ